LDPSTIPLLLIGAAALGIVATIAILRRNRRAEEDADRAVPYAMATEGMKRCPTCGFGNLVTDDTCASCGKHLPG
jgi:hypothetical protein